VEDSSNRSKLSKLLRFQSSTSEGKYVSLESYVSRMKEWQTSIFYIAGESVEACEKSVFMEKLRSNDVEVLYLVDPIDEYAIQNLTEFDGKKLQAVTKEGLTNIGDEDEDLIKRREQAYKDTFKPLTKMLKKLYGDKVEKVSITQRIANSPAVLVTSQYGYSANMERIMRSQAFADSGRTDYLQSRRTMEINPRHPIVAELNRLAEDGDSTESTSDLAWLLYDTALLNSGFTQDDPTSFAERMYRVMQGNLNLESLELEPEIEVPEEEDDDSMDGGEYDDAEEEELDDADDSEL